MQNADGLWWNNAAKNNLYRGMYLNSSNNFIVYDDSSGTGQIVMGRSGAGYVQLQNGQLRLPGAPTNCTGLPTNAVYSNSRVLTLCP
jgi:hypothetical protein